jgi:hypothetical protein
LENFKPHDIRKVPVTELQRQKNYLELVPRHSKEDYQRLKDRIVQDGLNPGLPIVVNDDEVVLDGYTRLQIAEELGLEWVYVTPLEFEDHYAEKLFIITANVNRRHLNTAQRAELALKLAEIEQEKARERQRQAGELIGKSNLKKGQELGLVNNGSQLVSNLTQAGNAINHEHGSAMKLSAREAKVSYGTVYKAKKIKQAAQTDPEVAEAWDRAKTGEASVDQVYRKFMEKSYFEKMTEKLPDPEPFPDEELLRALQHVADLKGIPREAINGAIELDPDVMEWFRLWSQGYFDAELAWNMTMEVVKIWQQEQRATLPEEIPVPEETHKLGPWALDFVHQARLEDLVREFPANSAHLIYSDMVADLEQVNLLGEFASRVLTEGKYLCIYIDKRHLPEAMSQLSAAGLTYFWSCAVFRPDDNVEVQERLVREKWRLLLIYRKGKASGAGWDWFEDAVENHRSSNRVLVRQLLMGLTMPGQLVVDPLVGSGIIGQVARSLTRRFLCFDADDADVRAANQRISQVRLAEETAI